MVAHRPERLAEALREEIVDVVTGEVHDPRVGLAQVTEVKLEPDLHLATVFVSVIGGPEAERECLQGLMAARSFVRSQLAGRLSMRKLPELRFEIDRSEQLGQRLGQLLQRDRKRATRRGAPAKEDHAD